MEIIEYRHTQGEKGLLAAIQLNANKKYWNSMSNTWDSELSDSCYHEMLELSAENLYNGNFDCYEFLKLYKDHVEEGLYVTAWAELNVAPGAMYSIHIFDCNKNLLSTTKRQKGSSMKFLEMVNEVQLRLGFPVSKRLSEPNAKKIGRMMNDVIGELLPCGNSTVNTKTLFRVLLKKDESVLTISPANCENLNGLGRVFYKGTELCQAKQSRIISRNNRLPDENVIVSGDCVVNDIVYDREISHGNPTEFCIVGKSNHDLTLSFNSATQEDIYLDIEVYERPRNLKRASDRTVYDSDLVIKGTEYLAKDDAGMGGDVSGRELFLRYLTTDSNLNSAVDWSKMSV